MAAYGRQLAFGQLAPSQGRPWLGLGQGPGALHADQMNRGLEAPVHLVCIQGTWP
eukprot:NODE_5293_length_718_cov_7.560538_g4450_i0.p3 GENE.NODE_5293_length_718_cov_7.560538_g4450_i0~~NODE_5293_length_718_cov_7.560538_g4450_i0.p3  ORF type:complete len:55 (+),score=8.84 NODE_5293_length_718_cov_7.560538_g4450_i0:252-416(+)